MGVIAAIVWVAVAGVCVRFDQLMLSKCAHNAVHTQDYTRGLQVHKYERISTAMEDDGTCSSNMHNIQYSDTDNVNIEMLEKPSCEV